MENKTLFKSVVADIARALRIKRVWPGEFNNDHAVYNGVSLTTVDQARQILSQFNSTPSRKEGVVYGEFELSLKYRTNGSIGEGETSEAAFFEALGSFTFEQQTFVVAVTYVDVAFMEQDATATAMIVVYPVN